MINPVAILTDFLLDQTALTTLTGQRVWGARTTPPGNLFTPGQHAVVFAPRGDAPDYTGRILNESFTFKCYGASDAHSYALYLVLVDVLHDKRMGAMRNMELQISGVPMQEPEPVNWFFTLSYFRGQFLRRET